MTIRNKKRFVIGCSFEAAFYAFCHQYCFILTNTETTPDPLYGEIKNKEVLEYFGIEEVGPKNKLDIWMVMLGALGFAGLMPYTEVEKIEISEDFLSIRNAAQIHDEEYEKLFIFNGEKLVNVHEKKNSDILRVLDILPFNRGFQTFPDESIQIDEYYVKSAFTLQDEEDEGRGYLVVISEFSDEYLGDPNYDQSMVINIVEGWLEERGYRVGRPGEEFRLYSFSTGDREFYHKDGFTLTLDGSFSNVELVEDRFGKMLQDVVHLLGEENRYVECLNSRT